MSIFLTIIYNQVPHKSLEKMGRRLYLAKTWFQDARAPHLVPRSPSDPPSCRLPHTLLGRTLFIRTRREWKTIFINEVFQIALTLLHIHDIHCSCSHHWSLFVASLYFLSFLCFLFFLILLVMVDRDYQSFVT